VFTGNAEQQATLSKNDMVWAVEGSGFLLSPLPQKATKTVHGKSSKKFDLL